MCVHGVRFKTQGVQHMLLLLLR